MMNKIKSEIAKMREMAPKDALEYFWSYYKIHVMILAIVIFFLVLILQANFGHKTELVFVGSLVDLGVQDEAAQRASEDFARFLELDGVNQTVELRPVAIQGVTVANMEKILVDIAASEVDVLLTTEDIALWLLKGGAISDLQVVLPEETQAHWRERMLYADAEEVSAWMAANREGEDPGELHIGKDPSGMAKPVPMGLDLTEECAAAFDRPADFGQVIGVFAVTTRRQEECLRFLDYLEAAA